MVLRRVLCLTFGTRGDVQPLLAFAFHLRQSTQCALTIATSQRFESWTREQAQIAYGSTPLTDDQFRFVPSDVDPASLLESKDMTRVQKGASSMRQLSQALREYASKYLETLSEDVLKHMENYGQEYDAIIGTVLTYELTLCLSEKYQIPCAFLEFLPTSPTRYWYPVFLHHSHPIIGNVQRNLFQWIRGLLNWTAYEISIMYLWRIRKEAVQARRKRLGLEMIGNSLGFRLVAESLNIPVIGAWSSRILPRAADWSPCKRVTGFLHLDTCHQNYTFPSVVENFIHSRNKQQALIYIGFGSLPVASVRTLLERVIEIQVATKSRIILCAGWTRHLTRQRGQEEPLASLLSHCCLVDELDTLQDKNILIIKEVPHLALFPLCDIVVHHGGAGTVGAVLHSGVPCVVCPGPFDEPFWATRLHSLGVAPLPLPFDQCLTPRALLSRIQHVLTHLQEYKNRARLLQQESESAVDAKQEAVLYFLEQVKEQEKNKTKRMEEMKQAIKRSTLSFVYRDEIPGLTRCVLLCCFIWLGLIIINI